MRLLSSWFFVILLSGSLFAESPRDTDSPFRLALESVFYADNTEFMGNPFREGETLLGVNVRGYLGWSLGDMAEFQLGGFIDTRAGSEKAFELARPIVSLVIGPSDNQFILGTLKGSLNDEDSGPERIGYHNLLPPIQMEVIAFTRGAYENGLQWRFNRARLNHDLWINWQALNTPEHREKFDAGMVSMLHLFGPVSLAGQAHIVHQGGQLYSADQPVGDSFAGGGGILMDFDNSSSLGPWDNIAVELYGIASKHVPNRENKDSQLTGKGVFFRTTLRTGDWRLHGITWQAWDFIKDEGDPNYGFRFSNGEYDPQTGLGGSKKYTEIGLARIFRITEGLEAEASARLHWIDSDLNYSYQIRVLVDLGYAFN